MCQKDNRSNVFLTYERRWFNQLRLGNTEKGDNWIWNKERGVLYNVLKKESEGEREIEFISADAETVVLYRQRFEVGASKKGSYFRDLNWDGSCRTGKSSLRGHGPDESSLYRDEDIRTNLSWTESKFKVL